MNDEDMFEDYDNIPEPLLGILDKYNENWDDTYAECTAMLKECEAVGYTFDYGLDAIPCNLRPIGAK